MGAGVRAGLAGTVVMTAFQKLIEMPLSGRGDSYAPARFAERVLGIRARTRRGRYWLNYATHFALGAMWGGVFGLARGRGLRGQRAVATLFPAIYAGDVLLNTALGLYHPTRWTGRDLAIDVVDKLVQAEATAIALDRASPAPRAYLARTERGD